MGKVSISLRSYTEAIDWPTVLYVLYSTVSNQQMAFLPENTSRNDAIFPKVYFTYIGPSRNA